MKKHWPEREAIILSMTPKERSNPGYPESFPQEQNCQQVQAWISAEVNRLVKQFEQSRKMMKQLPGMMGGKMGKRGELQASFLINVNTNKDIMNGGKTKMAVKIRLRRMGQKKAPFYRIVVADSRSANETEDASRKSEHMIRTSIQVLTK